MTGSAPAPRVPAKSERATMTGWFDPAQLMRTGMRVLVSELFGQNADRRILDSIAHRDIGVCDYSTWDELWLDYVSDTGDGWNATYGIAHQVAQPTLSVDDPRGTTHLTRRGQVLVFGGDEVYPTPSREWYEQKLVAPYRTALPNSAKPQPSVFAVPGNHDWYDSLVSFTRLFCGTRDRALGGWQARQSVSYFAVRLPHHWWLVGTDVQLDSDIDDPQLEYFRGVAKQMEDDARVILCTAEPHWIEEARYAKFDPSLTQRNLNYLEREVFGRRIEVFLSGDLHHYRRHEARDGRQKITAGGGGAYLSPTHHDVSEVATLPEGYTLKASFPSVEESKRLSWGNLLFIRHNPKFGILTAVLYLLLGWSVKVPLGAVSLREPTRALAALRDAVLLSPTAMVWGVLVVFGFVTFTDSHSPTQKRLGGTLHALAHLLAAFFSGWIGAAFAANVLAGRPQWLQWLTVGGFLLVGGYVVGSVIMGLYLLISLNLFHRHNTEAFSSMRIEDYKSWLRLQVTPDGALRIYPIKLHRVARKWRPAEPRDATPSLLVPDDPHATAPELIESPIVIPGIVRPGSGGYAAAAAPGLTIS
ncbi:hypothetical protein J421_4282 [Gemmatirosa kalamazoonensis]|uniref:Calcineurin-like phosphoesterase domain-containing protein n=1 Tax=Gemmatirosa kalamazoonensis TaxID=861299 RepID=W0RL68_9BACT|nr:hypothetical protein [Gemmatirosa kalamazoonensis]AHG91819.1 hypothetical protein J421_4282 [Gemmatirosa kalamazoonensis]